MHEQDEHRFEYQRVVDIPLEYDIFATVQLFWQFMADLYL